MTADSITETGLSELEYKDNPDCTFCWAIARRVVETVVVDVVRIHWRPILEWGSGAFNPNGGGCFEAWCAY